MNARTVFWLGASVSVAMAAMSSSLWAQNEAPPPVEAPPAIVTPPAVVKPPAIAPQDLAFGRFIALIRAHLLTGDELVGRREWGLAARHYNFPIEEIYGIIRDEVRTYRTPPFDGALKALVRTVKAHSAKQYPKARQKVEDALVAADAGLRARQPNWPRFTVAVAMEVLKVAPDEYDDAVAKLRIVHPIGYQTARGLILQADRMFESVADELGAGNAAALSNMQAGFAQLKPALINVNAPKQAAMDEGAMSEVVSRIERAASPFM
jgi:hypothetical protein